MKQLTGTDLKKMFIAGSRILKNNRDVINILNTFPVPDGDTGTNMDLTLRSALTELEKVHEDSVSLVANTMASGSLLGARGNSGVILSQLFRGFAKALEGKKTISSKEFAAALDEGVNTAYKAVMKPVEGTILTVARESAKTAAVSANKGANFTVLMEDVFRQAEITLEKTPDMLPVLKEAGVVDSGGKGLLHIYEGFMLHLQGKIVLEESELVVEKEPLPEVTDIKPQGYFRTEDIVFAYCTELIVRGSNLNAENVRDVIAAFGDSVLAVGDESVVKIHIHTNNPGNVLQECLVFGTLHNIKIENMREQHEEILFNETDRQEVVSPAVKHDSGDIGCIAVSAGEGLTKILHSLGVQKVISGGQTMNPSTEEILQAVKELPHSKIIILPNNKNIILAAEQVKELTDKEVRVIKTKSVPQGIAAMLSYNPEAILDENYESMTASSGKIKSGQVTYAICDSKLNGKVIKENDIIAICEAELVSVGNNLNKVVKDLLYKMVHERDEIITLYAGEPVSRDDATSLQQELAALFAGKEVELYEGGQPLYYYLVSVE